MIRRGKVPLKHVSELFDTKSQEREKKLKKIL